MGIVEAGKQSPSSGINLASMRTTPNLDLLACADGNDAVAQDCDRLRLWLRWVDSPDPRVLNY
jgi:hypothetical protein